MKIDDSLFDTFHIPDELKFCNTGIWMIEIKPGIILCGLTEYTVETTGEIISVDFIRNVVNMEISAGDRLLDIDSIKDSLSLNSPLTGTVLEINENCLEAPYLINLNPYTDGWLFIIEIKDYSEYERQMDYNEYQFFVIKEKEESEIL